MRYKLMVVVSCAVLSALKCASANETKDQGKDEARDRVEVTKFLKGHVMGKTLATPKVTFKLHDNKMEGEYEDLTTFSNFTETAHGFSFDVTSMSKETRFDLDKAGKRIQPGRDNSGTEVFRYEICERASTKKLTGTARLLSKTTKGSGYEGCAILVMGMKLADGKLVWSETLPGYMDFIATKGKYKPGSWDSKYTVSVVDGKLRTEFESKRFDVDPDTLKRTATADKMPVYVAQEIDQK
jgi:hypothetical protein